MVEEQLGEGYPDFEAVGKELSETNEENQYLRSRNFGLQDAVDSNFIPKPDSNVIEFKLSSEELLERIEHYLKGDILKTKINEDKQIETYYATPTKKISVNLYKNEKNGRIYVVDQTLEERDKWKILNIIERDERNKIYEIDIEQNYQATILKELLEGIDSKLKKKIVPYGIATKEVFDNSRTNLSEYGVQEVMNVLSMYITKETFLSWYKEERIYEILGDLGDHLNKFFLINGKLLGLDTEYKKTKYPMIIVTILHAVENAYRRALLGSENKGTREGIIVTQHQPMGGYGNMGAGTSPQRTPKKRWSPFDKSTW